MTDLELYKEIDAKLEKQTEALYLINAQLSAIKVDLAHHIRRSDMLEEQMKFIDKDVNKLKGFFSIGGWVVGILATILTILNKLGIL